MVGRRAFAVAVVVLSTTTVVLLGAGAEAGAVRPDRAPGPPEGRPAADHVHADAGGGVEADAPSTTVVDGTVQAPGPGPSADGGTVAAVDTVSTPPRSVSEGIGHAVGPPVGGAPATTQGAADTEALAAATAPTPPNGAEPAAAWSPVAAAQPDGTDGVEAVGEALAVPSSAAEVPALPELLRSVVGVTDPRPEAHGLSPDTAGSGALIAILALVVSLFVVGHQLLDRGDPRRSRARVVEAVARFP